MKSSDVIILGGGPGGLAAGLLLARRGFAVQLFEKRRFPVDKACGEGIMPTGLALLRQLGVELGGHPFTGINYSMTDSSVRAGADFAEGPGLAVRRLELSAALHRACLAQSGLVLREGTPARLRALDGEGAAVEAEGALHRAPLVVAADGLHSPTRHWAGLQGGSSRARRWGLRQHFAIAPWSSRVEVLVTEGAELYLCPIGSEEVGVSIILREPAPGVSFERALERFPQVRERLQGASPTSLPRALGPLEQRAIRFSRPGLILLGDACGYIDACTGEGISLALAQAKILADHLPASLRERDGCLVLPDQITRAARR